MNARKSHPRTEAASKNAATSTAPSRRRMTPGLWAVAAVATAGLAVTGGGVYAALTAEARNTTAQNVSSGTMTLAMAANGAGFSQSVSNMAPGDAVNRYVNLAQGGTTDGRALTLAVSPDTTNSFTRAALISVSQCAAGTWSAAGVCSGTVTPLLTNVPLTNFGGAGTPYTPQTLVAGAVASGSTYALQVSVSLPDTAGGDSVNGAAPSGVEGQSAGLTWQFATASRAGTVTNS